MGRYLPLLLSVAFTVLGQIAFKLQMLQAGPLPAGFLLIQAFRPWGFSGVIAGCFAVLFWMAALTRFELSVAYPFSALSFVLMVLLSHWCFRESLTPLKLFGVLLIVGGIVLVGKG
jgi:multidrug transporter EmrE-like cation transporter